VETVDSALVEKSPDFRVRPEARMDSTRSKTKYSATVRPDWGFALGVLLRAGAGDRRESGIDASSRRAIPANSVLGSAEHDLVVGPARCILLIRFARSYMSVVGFAWYSALIGLKLDSNCTLPGSREKHAPCKSSRP
jgi:hypothetical protein